MGWLYQFVHDCWRTCILNSAFFAFRRKESKEQYVLWLELSLYSLWFCDIVCQFMMLYLCVRHRKEGLMVLLSILFWHDSFKCQYSLTLCSRNTKNNASMILQTESSCVSFSNRDSQSPSWKEMIDVGSKKTSCEVIVTCYSNICGHVLNLKRLSANHSCASLM